MITQELALVDLQANQIIFAISLLTNQSSEFLDFDKEGGVFELFEAIITIFNIH